MFEQSLCAAPPGHQAKGIFLSLTAQTAAIGIALLIPLIFTERLSLTLNHELLVAPQPPAPMPPVAKVARPTHANAGPKDGVFRVPPRIPPRIADIHEEAVAAPDIVVPGAVPGGSGVGNGSPIANLINALPKAAALVPPPAPVKKEPAPQQPIQVSSGLQSGMLLRQVKPAYPPLARQVRISGTVRLTGQIGKDGTIQKLSVMSGHPLLIPAALEAVRQWVYRPTILNGEPVEVITTIDVNFTLTQ